MRPVIGVVADVKQGDKHTWHKVQEKYLYAVGKGADAAVIILPGRLSATDTTQPAVRSDPERLFAILDGVFLPGSPSNVEPARYGEELSDPDSPLDKDRDDLSMPLIKAAVERGLPLFGVCRGYQEMNAALGGTLHQKVQEVAGYMDHREDGSLPIPGQYGPAHDVELVEGGVLHGLLNRGRTGPAVKQVKVNSLHGQGVKTLAPGLAVEARAPDGLIEAFHVEEAHKRGHFAVAVQWHPEWQFWADPLSTALFTAFGEAARAYAAKR